MKKLIKRILIAIPVLIICTLLVLANISLLSIPKSIDYRIDEVRAAWSRGNGPEVNGTDIDYSYYSPVENGASSDKKYPMIIIMAGALEGLQEGFELVANAMPKWTTAEYQARFTDGGAYLFIARAPEEDWLYWDDSDLTPSLKAAVDAFCQQNSNVDKNEIHIIGWCLGGNGAINLATSYPDEFASTTIMCPDRAITESEAQALKNMPVWFMGSETDTYSNYKNCILKSYNLLCEASSRKGDVRLTSYSSAPDVPLLETLPFIYNHNLWDNLAEDMATGNPEYPDMKTVDGNGNTVENSSAILWLDSISLADNRESSEARDTESFSAKMHFLREDIKVLLKSGLMRIMLNSFTILGWI